MRNLKNVLNYKCRRLSNCGTNITVVGKVVGRTIYKGGLSTWGDYRGRMYGVLGMGLYTGGWGGRGGGELFMEMMSLLYSHITINLTSTDKYV